MPRPWSPRVAGPLVALALLIVAVLPRAGAGAVGRPPGVVVGINANTLGFGASAGTIQSLLRAGNLRWIREDVLWRDVEPRRGARRWMRYDRLYADSARRGIRVLPLLHGTPRWAGRTKETLPVDPEPFAAFAARFARRYGPGGEFWATHPELPALPSRWLEVWNEPSNPVAAGGPPNPRRYARLYHAVVRMSARVAPDARFLLYADGDVRVDGRWVSWIDAMFEAVPALAGDVHGISVHPYSLDLARHTPGRDAHQFARFRSYRDRFAAHGVQAPIWLTEVGWSTCKGHRSCVSRRRQAALVRELMRRLQTTYRGEIRAVFLYGYADSGTDPRSREQRFGLVTPQRRPKPAWRELTRILGS